MKLYGAIGLEELGSIPPFRQNFGLTLDEFIPTVWELIPYSFLVDYVTNIGAIIDGYSLNKSGLKWLAIGEERVATTKVSGEIRIRPSIVSGNQILDSIIRPSTPLIRIRRYLSRAPYNYANLVPPLEFKIPGCSTQWLNIGALAYLHEDTSNRLRNRYRF